MGRSAPSGTSRRDANAADAHAVATRAFGSRPCPNDESRTWAVPGDDRPPLRPLKSEGRPVCIQSSTAMVPLPIWGLGQKSPVCDLLTPLVSTKIRRLPGSNRVKHNARADPPLRLFVLHVQYNPAHSGMFGRRVDVRHGLSTLLPNIPRCGPTRSARRARPA